MPKRAAEKRTKIGCFIGTILTLVTLLERTTRVRTGPRVGCEYDDSCRQQPDQSDLHTGVVGDIAHGSEEFGHLCDRCGGGQSCVAGVANVSIDADRCAMARIK